MSQSINQTFNQWINQPINPLISQSNSQSITQSWLQNRLTKAQDVFLVEDNLLRKTRYWNQTYQNQKSCFRIFFGQSRLSNLFWILRCVCTGSGNTPDRKPIPSRSDRNSQSYSRIFWACVWILMSRSFGSNRSYFAAWIVANTVAKQPSCPSPTLICFWTLDISWCV